MMDANEGYDGPYIKRIPYVEEEKAKKEKTKKQLRAELKRRWRQLLEEDEELCNEILSEMRNEKLKKIKTKI